MTPSKQAKWLYYILSFGILLLLPPLLISAFAIQAETAYIIGIFIASLILWLKIDIGWPSVLCLGLLGLLPSVGYTKVLSLSLGNSTFAFLMFTFICTYALSKTSVIQRIATAMIASKFSKKGPWYFIIMYMLAIYVVGLFISPTVLYVVFFPIFEEICSILKLEKGHRTSQFLALSIIMMLALSSGATPISHVFSIMAMSIYQTTTGLTISYGAYMAMGIPTTLLILVIWLLTAKYIYKPDLSMIQEMDFSHLKENVPPTSRRDRWITGVFAVMIVLWLAPDFIKGFLPEVATVLSGYGLAFPPILGTVALALIEIDGKPLVSVSEAMSKGVQWPSLLMASATLALGSVFTMEGIGILEILQNILTPLTANVSLVVLVVILVAWASIQTNLSSNMVTVSIVTPIAITSLQSLGASPAIIASTAALIGLMASLAFATPPAMPYVALTIGSEWANADTVLKYGLWMMLVSILAAVTLGYSIGLLFMV